MTSRYEGRELLRRDLRQPAVYFANPSLEPTCSGKARRPPRAQYHVAPVGQRASPPRSSQLKR
jgi:hypothetical protein